MEEQKQKSEMHRRDAITAYNLKMELKLRGVRQREEERRGEEKRREEKGGELGRRQ